MDIYVFLKGQFLANTTNGISTVRALTSAAGKIGFTRKETLEALNRMKEMGIIEPVGPRMFRLSAESGGATGSGQ